MGCSISRAGHVDLKRYYPGSCLHPSPEGLGIQPKHSSPLVGWETQNKIENRDYLIYLFFTVSQPTPQPVPLWVTAGMASWVFTFQLLEEEVESNE